MPIEVNNPDEQETVEVPLAEYEAVKVLAAGIAEQNALMLKSIDALRGEMVAQAETQTTNMGAFLDAFKEMFSGMNITVNVPEQPAPVVNFSAPAPVVNFTAPEQPAPIVNVSTPAEKGKRVVKVKRGKNGYASEYEIE
jgi:hypothetical protein